jgi:hypothetical protein
MEGAGGDGDGGCGGVVQVVSICSGSDRFVVNRIDL